MPGSATASLHRLDDVRKVGRSGSPMPRLITSSPPACFSATCRSSSANMYGGHRLEALRGRGQVALGGLRSCHRKARVGAWRLADELAVRMSSGESSPGRPAPRSRSAARRGRRQTSTSSSPPSSSTVIGLGGAPRGRPRPRRRWRRCPRTASPPPRARRSARAPRMPFDPGRTRRWCGSGKLVSLDLRADRGQVELLELVARPRSRTAGCRSRRAGSATRAPPPPARRGRRRAPPG